MARLILYLILTLPGANVFAGQAQGTVICERLLTPDERSPITLALSRNILGRPHILSTVHEMTGLGLVKMGLDPNSSNRALRDLVLMVSRQQTSLVAQLMRFANGGFKTIQRFEIQDPDMHGYSSPTVGEVGYHTEFDQDGVRRFISFEQLRPPAFSSVITLGIDVPRAMAKAEKYSPDLSITDELKTTEGNFRRIGVLTFIRVHDDIYEN